jgi:glycosyltransferase involved in cell wall biosynthesis
MITIGIPTRDRPRSLERLLAALHMQSYQHWDLVIVNDSAEDMLYAEGQFWLQSIADNGHAVDIVPGVRINQTYAHNHVLWRADAHPLILRMDDDLFPQADFIEVLVQIWTGLVEDGVDVAGLGGVYFTEHIRKREEHPPIPTSQHEFTEVLKDGSVSPLAQMQEYSDSDLIPAQHLYSSYLYDRDKMRAVGGFPSVYSIGVSYHEETEASYKLHLAGHKLFIVPDAKAVHSHAEGGTRLLSGPEHRRRRDEDWKLFLGRIPMIRAVDFEHPKVCLYSDHWSGLGGGQRLSYGLASAILETGICKRLHLLGPAHESVMPGSFVREHFGVDLEPQIILNQDRREEWENVTFDLVISLGHHPPAPDQIPPRKKHIHYCLYPRFRGEIPKFVDRYVAISEYSANAIRSVWRRNPDIIYPYVNLDDPGQVKKSNRVLIVGRSSGKGVEEMARVFLEMAAEEDMPDDLELRIVVPSEDDDGYARIKNLGNHERVTILSSLSSEELVEEYRAAAVLWAGRGYNQPPYNPDITREHFGYTPVEALVNMCVPACFDDGGYQETTLLRWKNLEELEEITRALLLNREFWTESLANNREYLGRFARERFVKEWHRVLTTTHSLAWDSGVEWRRAEDPEISVTDQGVHIACISDHPCDPERQTGYSVFAEMLFEGLREQGWHLHVFAARGDHNDAEGRYDSLWVSNSDESFKRFIQHRNFDAALVVYDPYITSDFVRAIHTSGMHIPTIACATQEGLPPHHRWETIVGYADKVFTFSKVGAEAISYRYGKPVDWLYAGLDHAPFRKLDGVDRNILRDMLHWEDRFILFSVCRNARNKRVAAMMQVAKILRYNYGYNDVMLLLHTEIVPKLERHGTDIRSYVKTLDLEDDDLIYISGRPHLGGVPYDVDLETLYRAGRPRSRTEASKWLRELPMIVRYNIADLYLDLSGAEGFGLPLLEAIACGTPAVSVNDEYIRRELLGPQRLIPAVASDTWITGAELMLVDPADVAYEIHQYRRGKDALVIRPDEVDLSELNWKAARDKVVNAIRECVK